MLVIESGHTYGELFYGQHRRRDVGLMSYARLVMDVNDDGECINVAGQPVFHERYISELTDEDFDVRYAKSKGLDFTKTMFPNHFQQGDQIVVYNDMTDGAPLSGRYGYLLVRAGRVVAHRWTMMS